MDKETLLIVEDNHILRNGLKEMLSMEGFFVMTAGNGQEGLEQMVVTSPDLILSDIAMPIMDGYAFFKEVRARPEWVTIPFLFLTARGEREDITAGRDLGVEDYLVKPLTRDELLTAVRSRLARSRQLHVVQLQSAYEASLTMLANAIEVRNEYTRGHVERVTAYALLLADQLGWQGKRLEALRFGAILHDIGKIHVPETILTKRGPLSPDEWVEIKRHPINGAEMIRDISYLTLAVPVVRHHHERYDGKGYPDGLTGESIPLEARIVTVADGLDAMTTTRSYRLALSLSQACEEIIRCAGTQFDPLVVEAFRRAWDSHQIHLVMANGHF